MKKIISLLLAVLLCMTLFVSCIGKDVNPDNKNDNEITENGNKENTPPKKNAKDEDEKLSELRDAILEDGAILGIAYLGYNEGEFSDIGAYLEDIGLYDEYPFVKDLESDDFFETDGGELYLVVPADNKETVKVYDGVLNEETYELEKGELLGESANGKPFLLLCNVSEIIPNVIISTGTLEYSPYLSGEDGELVENQDIYDFSPYEKIKEYYKIQYGLADGADPIFCGSWFGESENGDYELMAMNLELYVDGTAAYVYGIGNSEPIEWFMGEWNFDADRDMILLDMYGGPPNDYVDSDELFIDPYELKCGFKWDMDYRDDGTYLILTHEEGDPILWGKNGATFEFAEASEPEEEEDYSYLCATWAKISERVETYLELFEDGSANFSHTDVDGNEIFCHGTWFADGLTLFLDLYDSEDNTKLIYSGEYGIMYDGEILTLSHFDGDYLTAFMTDEGYDSFVYYAVG